MKNKFALYTAVVVLVLATLACGTTTVTPPTSTPLPPPTATNPPVVQSDALTITSTNAFVDASGTYHVVGEVSNTGSTPLTSIELTLEIKDASGNSLLQDDSGNVAPNTTLSPMLFTLAPGEASPFEYSYDTSKGTPASYNVTVTGQQTGSANRAALKQENVSLVDDGSGWYYLTGELVNTSTQWAHINSLAGGVLDASGNLLSADLTSTYATELAPAGDADGLDRTPFEINFPNPGASTQWALYWDADTADNVTGYPMSISVTNSYFDENGSAHLVGWLTNNYTDALTSLVVAGLYAQDGTALDASYAFVPVTIKPDAKVPFSVSSFGSVDHIAAQAALVNSYSAQPDTWFTYPPSADSVDLSATGETVQKDGSAWTFNGNVTNSSTKSLKSATVMVLVKDASGTLVAMEYTTIYPSGDAIAVGEKNSYSLTIYLDPKADTTGYTTTTIVVGEVK